MATTMSDLAEHRRAVLDYYLGEGTAERWAVERIIREREDAVADGRRHEGSATTWYASITWSRNAWYALHGVRGPRR
jgi:hypothetical protein